MILRFGPFVLDRDRAELTGPSGLVSMEPKAFALLCLLAENHDRVVSKEEMIAAVWGGRFLSDAAVSTVLKLVRKALGDDGVAQRYVRTVRGRGHRFVAPVQIGPATVAVAAEPRSAPDQPAPPADPGRPTIAILPFTATGLPAPFAPLADAIPAELISALSRLRWLRVIARESSFRYRGASVELASVRGVLGAGFCLSGQVECTGRRITVTVDLADTRSGAVIWSDRFERSIDDIHEIRRQILAAVVAALDLQIPQVEAALARAKPVEHLDAWGAYHLGLAHMHRFNGHDNAIAAGLFRRATTLDPGFASAFAALSFTSTQNVLQVYTTDREAAVTAARAEAERSMELDPLDPFANLSMGRLSILSRRAGDGLVWLDRAVEISPNYAKGHYSRGFLQVLCCRPLEARGNVDVASLLSPLDPMTGPMAMMRALSFAIDGDYPAAADWAIRGARISPSHFGGLMIAEAMCLLAGRPAEAAHWQRAVGDLRPDASVSKFFNGMHFESDAFRAKMTAALRAAGLQQ